MMSLIQKKLVKLYFLKQADGIRHGYEAFCLKVNPLVVARPNFAETREVWSKLVQQGS